MKKGMEKIPHVFCNALCICLQRESSTKKNAKRNEELFFSHTFFMFFRTGLGKSTEGIKREMRKGIQIMIHSFRELWIILSISETTK